MNEQTVKIIEQLALKLGTTTEYLWAVLIRQAPIEATVILFQMALVVTLGVALWKTHNQLTETVKLNAYHDGTGYDKHGDVALLGMIIASAVWVVLIICCFYEIPTIINGFFNPEYWALKRVLELI